MYKKPLLSKTFRYLKGTSIILGLYLLGEGFVSFTGLHFPGSIIGMLLLFLSLHFKWIKLHDIHDVSDFVLRHMALFFIPAGVSILGSYTVLQGYTLAIVVTVVLSTFIVLSSSALLLEYFLKSETK